jgi:GTP cyclohydrolase II
MSEPLVLTDSADPAAHAAPEFAILAAVDRATAELRRGALVVLADAGAAGGALVLAAETITDEVLADMAALAGPAAPVLAMSAQRAAALGFAPAATAAKQAGPGVAAIGLAGGLAPPFDAANLRRLADPTEDDGSAPPSASGLLAKAPAASREAAHFAAAAIGLTKLARLLPAAVVAPLGAGASSLAAWARRHDLLLVGAAAIAAYQDVAARSLRRVGEARVPLEGAENARIVAFRPDDGGVEHLAIVVGAPAPDQPVLTRLHSECFTGDLLGSLRCDCGDQLRGAIAEIGRQGSGLLLYLAQEGRGIGLVNKLRAYELQDRGADTVDANRQLGFDPDERIYQPAAEMLRQLGFSRVRLMTNNPEKVAGLARCGIAVTERVPHVIPANGHNADYLRTKATRLGHMF